MESPWIQSPNIIWLWSERNLYSVGGGVIENYASAEVVGKIRKLLNDNNIFWQMAEMGKNDAGGGGTVANFMAQRNIDTLDAGVPVLSMHAPYETVAKLDCYMTYRCMKAFFEGA